MLKDRARHLHSLVLSADVVVSACVFLCVLSVSGFGDIVPGEGRPLVGLLVMGLVSSLSWPISLDRLELYGSNRRRPLLDVLSRLNIAAVVSTSLLFLVSLGFGAPVDSSFPILCGIGQLIALSLMRMGVFTSLRILRRSGRNFRNVLIVGSGPLARQVLQGIDRHPEWGLRISGFVDDRDVAFDPHLGSEDVHKFNEFPRLLSEYAVNEVILACPRSMLSEITPVVATCAEEGVPFLIPTNLFGDYLPPPKVTTFDGLGALSFAPVHHGRMELALKRVVDLVGATVLLALSAPILAVAAAAIRLNSQGPMVFRQLRCGAYGQPFEMLKLRTMCAEAEDQKQSLLDLNEMDGPVFKIADDPRITGVGRFLRRWSIDEIPQLWNVIKGDMSLVGPRPPVPLEVAQYETGERRRLSMRPGLTCIWQVNGRNTIGFEDWVRLDVEYIDTWSLVNDFKLLLKTIPAVIRGNGAS